MKQQITGRVDRWSNAVHSELSVALMLDDEGGRERARRLKHIKSPFLRAAAQLVHQTVGLNPAMFRGLFAGPYERRGFEVVGFGSSATVIHPHDDEIVTKVLRSTVHLDVAAQGQKVDRLRSDQGLVIDRFSDIALPQDFDVTEHPLHPSRGVVVGRQALVHGFEPVLIHNSRALTELGLGQRKELARFTTDALEMADSVGYIPDVVGAGNIGFGDRDEGLMLVDTLPIPILNAELFDTATCYTEKIAAAVTTTRHIT